MAPRIAAGRRRTAPVAVDQRRGEALHAPSGRAVHDVDAAAGGRPQAAAVLEERHARRAAALRERLHHLHAYRLDHAVGERDHRRTEPGRATSTAPTTCPPSHAGMRARSRTRRRRTRRSARPVTGSARRPQVAGELRGDEFALYELIWKRTVASQMADARGSTATVQLTATLDGVEVARTAEFTASGTVITFRGFLAAYEEGRDETAAKKRKEIAEEERRLPKLGEGTPLAVIRAEADGHETQPPPRYTEATLVKAMEEKGIGRPSTYASIMGTIQDRGYVGHPRQRPGADLAGVRRDAAARGALPAAGRLRLHRVAWRRTSTGSPTATSSGSPGSSGSTSATRRSSRRGAQAAGRRPRRDRRPRDLDDPARRRDGRPRRSRGRRRGGHPGRRRRATGECSSTGARPSAAPRHDQRRHRPRRDDAGQGARAARRGRRRRTRARPGPLDRQRDHRQGGRYGPYVTEVLPEAETDDAAPKRGKAARRPSRAPRSLFKDMDLASDRPRRRAAAALAAACGRDGRPRRTARRSRSPHRTAATGPTSRRAPTRGRWRPSSSSSTITLDEALAIYAQPKQRGRARRGSAQGARHRPGVGQAGDGQGRPVRGLRHRRRDQRHAAHATTTPSRSRPSAGSSCWPRSGPRVRRPASERRRRPRSRRPRRRPRRRRRRPGPPGRRPRRERRPARPERGGDARTVDRSRALDPARRRAAEGPAAVGRRRARARRRAGVVGAARHPRRARRRAAADADTQYRIGSITKTFVAVCVLRLRDAGRLDLDDRFERPRARLAFGDATIAQLLTHTSGMQSETAGPWWERTPGGDWAALRRLARGQRFRAGAPLPLHERRVRRAGRARRAGPRARLVRRRARDLLDPLGHERGRRRGPPGRPRSGWRCTRSPTCCCPSRSTTPGRWRPRASCGPRCADLGRWAAFLGGDTGGHARGGHARRDVSSRTTSVDDRRASRGSRRTAWASRCGTSSGARFAGHGGSMPGFLAGLQVRPVETGDGVVVLQQHHQRAGASCSSRPAHPGPRARAGLPETWYAGRLRPRRCRAGRHCGTGVRP